MAGDKPYLLVNQNWSEFADDIPEDTDDYSEEEEEINTRANGLVTLKILKAGMPELEVKELLTNLNVALDRLNIEPITWEEI